MESTPTEDKRMKQGICVLGRWTLLVFLWMAGGTLSLAASTPPAKKPSARVLKVAQASCPAQRARWSKLFHSTTPCSVWKVVDGDTVKVICNGRRENLRLVGIDTPETKHPFKPVEYYGPQASNRAKSLMPKGTPVCLSFTKKGRGGTFPRGKYGRVLAYIFFSNGKMFNAGMVRDGYAFALRRYPHTYMNRFVKLENRAKRARRGMWSDMAKVRALVASDQAYRRQRKACYRKYGRSRWVVGDTRTKYFYMRSHGYYYFKTNPSTRRLFCNSREARAAGYTYAPRKRKGRRYRRRRYRRNNSWGSSLDKSVKIAGGSGVLVLANPRTKTYRVFRGGYRIFPSVKAAKNAGFRPERRGRSARAAASPSNPNCRVVGNKRSKVFRTPGMRSYKRALRSKNAVFFCSAQEALNKGYRKAKR